jgi:hypothetical protein
MQNSETVMVSGGPLPEEVGDRIVAHGIRLASVWAAYVEGFQLSVHKSDHLSSTEVGTVVEWPSHIHGAGWQWQIPHKKVNFHFEPVGNDVFEVIIKVRAQFALQTPSDSNNVVLLEASSVDHETAR